MNGMVPFFCLVDEDKKIIILPLVQRHQNIDEVYDTCIPSNNLSSFHQLSSSPMKSFACSDLSPAATPPYSASLFLTHKLHEIFRLHEDKKIFCLLGAPPRPIEPGLACSHPTLSIASPPRWRAIPRRHTGALPARRPRAEAPHPPLRAALGR
jgi:hypothetical protein